MTLLCFQNKTQAPDHALRPKCFPSAALGLISQRPSKPCGMTLSSWCPASSPSLLPLNTCCSCLECPSFPLLAQCSPQTHHSDPSYHPFPFQRHHSSQSGPETFLTAPGSAEPLSSLHPHLLHLILLVFVCTAASSFSLGMSTGSKRGVGGKSTFVGSLYEPGIWQDGPSKQTPPPTPACHPRPPPPGLTLSHRTWN